jgi:hypothetical protein
MAESGYQCDRAEGIAARATRPLRVTGDPPTIAALP